MLGKYAWSITINNSLLNKQICYLLHWFAFVQHHFPIRFWKPSSEYCYLQQNTKIQHISFSGSLCRIRRLDSPKWLLRQNNSLPSTPASTIPNNKNTIKQLMKDGELVLILSILINCVRL